VVRYLSADLGFLGKGNTCQGEQYQDEKHAIRLNHKTPPKTSSSLWRKLYHNDFRPLPPWF
jgi:hypothetical protein